MLIVRVIFFEKKLLKIEKRFSLSTLDKNEIMRTLNAIVFYLLLAISFLSCSPEEIKEEMVLFDRSFIPVWYYVEMGNFQQATKAFNYLEEEWEIFKQSTTPYTRNVRQWKSSLARVDDWMATTQDAIATRDAELAINQLDHARYELMDWRWRWKLDYFLDKVWDLEASIDVAKSAALDPILDLLEWEEYQRVNEDIRQSWEQIQNSQPDPRLHHLEETQIQDLNLRHSELDALLNAYLKEGQCLNTCEYEAAIESLHYAFLNYLKTFGDFSRLNWPEETWSAY